MRLVFPTLAYKDKAIDFIREFYEYNRFEQKIYGTGGLDRYLKNSSYEAWIHEKVIPDVDVADLAQGRVPALTYFLVRESDDTIVGMVNIRLVLTDFLKRDCGHIGYCIRPSERRKGYATRLVQLALEVCDVFGHKEVIIVCNKDNVASAGVIKKCGGQLREEFFSQLDHTDVQNYVISRE